MNNTDKAIEALERALSRKVWREDGWEAPAIDVQTALDALKAGPEATYTSNADQFSQFPIGQVFYPEKGRDATYRFVKTGETSVVRIHQVSGATHYVADVFAEGHYDHWRDYPAGLIAEEDYS